MEMYLYRRILDCMGYFKKTDEKFAKLRDPFINKKEEELENAIISFSNNVLPAYFGSTDMAQKWVFLN